MKKAILFLALLPSLAFGAIAPRAVSPVIAPLVKPLNFSRILFQTTFSTQTVMAYNAAITNPGGQFGAPRFTTALLPDCTLSNNIGALAYDTTAAAVKVCSGSAWAAFSTGGVPTYPLLAPDGSFAAPSYGFSAGGNAGFLHSGGFLFLQGKDGSGTDAAGEPFQISPGKGTGTGSGGNLNLTVAPPGASTGASVNSLQTGLQISGGNGNITAGGINVVTPAGTSTYSGSNAASGQTDKAGAAVALRGGLGTGAGAGGDVTVSLSVPAATSSTQHTFQSMLIASGTNGSLIMGSMNLITAPAASSWQGANTSLANTAGGAVNITGGTASNGNADGGAITLTGGAPVGTGVRGRVQVASTTWLQRAGNTIRLTGNYTNSTTSFTATSLSMNVVTGRAYAFSAILFASETTAADGAKLDFNGGSATSTNFVASCVLSNAVGTNLAQTNATSAALATVINIGAFTDTAVHIYQCMGTFEPSSTGTFIIRGAQNAHTAGTLTLLRGSSLVVEDIP